MKRTLPTPPGDMDNQREAAGPVMKRARLDGIAKILSLDDYHDDILLSIALKVLDDYPLRPSCLNPFGYMHILSKRWKGILECSLTREHLRFMPNSALHLLEKQKFNYIGLLQDFDLLQAAAPLLNLDERFRAMMGSTDISALKLISDLPAFRVTSHGVYSDSVKRLHRQMSKAYPQLNIERKKICARDGELEVSDELFLFQVPPQTILKRVFLDDLHLPNEYTWIFFAVSKSICHIYWKDKRHIPKLVEWLGIFKGINLPFTRFDVIAESMIWPMTLAFLLEDWEFLKLLDIEYESLKNTERSTSFLAKALIKCMRKGLSFLPRIAIPHLEEIFISQACHGFMGFDQLALRLALQNILPRFTKPEAIAAIQELILDQ